MTWYTAHCPDCEPVRIVQFPTVEELDAWVETHIRRHGHRVVTGGVSMVREPDTGA